MTPRRAAELLTDKTAWTDPREYLEAALYMSIHPHHRDMIPVQAYATAVKLADYAVDNGEEAAVDLIIETMLAPHGKAH